MSNDEIKKKPGAKKTGKWVVVYDKNGTEKSAEKAVPEWCIFLIVLVCISLAITCYFLIKNGSKVIAKGGAIIHVENVQETRELEVLSVSVKEVMTESKDDNKDGIEAWTEFTGKGVFVVDLAKSQFLVDEARNVVVVRTPKVKFSTDRFTIDYGKTTNLLFYNAGFNDNYLDGSNLYYKQLREAYIKIYNKLYTNPYYYGKAESAAEKIIKSMVEGFNSEVEGLQVYVEVGVL